MRNRIKKYSFLIRPLLTLVDLIIIFLAVYYFSHTEYLSLHFFCYTVFSWFLISYYTKFYKIYRYTHISKLLGIMLTHFFVFILAFLSYFTLFKEGEIISEQFKTIITFVLIITFFKILSFYLLKKYRFFGGNYRNIIVFGNTKSAQRVVSLFKNKQELGYRFRGLFSDKTTNVKDYLGTIKEGLVYALNNSVDEIYYEVNSISPHQFKEIRNFANNNNIEIRLIPENKAIYSKNFTLEYFGTIPILKPKELPFEKIETHILKRIFDFVFSVLVCIFLLSWLLPILWFLVKIDSKGAFFFKQIRDGADGKKFYCYKIRSMKSNVNAHKIHATKNDSRITKMGAFLRKTSLDELPQFFNVLMGDMSVVGPRPHMNIQTEKYLKEIENYIIRNSVKPGITGLAQVSGYRGEVKKKSDIENRVRLDIFYIENWSFILDLKIVFLTIFNVFKGQDKAY
ncbi:exopolysaccharide biosynthesis polyprenyl glycosylphosphotransferase [Polaribacter atrinae]|uniref:exopolysaccharide biosynthesis polyprenyl glycosylphosphotransferase n=1 Tax=Polaribacter atrinae TaxID=1333662 RepID=UPI0030F90560